GSRPRPRARPPPRALMTWNASSADDGQPGAFPECVPAVSDDILERLDPTTRPSYHELPGAGGGAEPEVEPGVVRGLVARPGVYLLHLASRFGLDSHSDAGRSPVRIRAGEREGDPVSGAVAAVVAEQGRGTVEVVDRDVQVAVVVEVRDRRSAARPALGESAPQRFGDVLELAVAEIAEED